MIPPVIPQDNQIVIETHRGRCHVARFRQTDRFTFVLQHAANWQALETDARLAVEDQVGAITTDDIHPCPDDLAARATWPDDYPSPGGWRGGPKEEQ